jgi:hypothetical protein
MTRVMDRLENPQFIFHFQHQNTRGPAGRFGSARVRIRRSTVLVASFIPAAWRRLVCASA